MHLITIAARNYLQRARVLARTHLEHNPEDSFTILLVDAEPGEITSDENYTIATPADLPIDADEFRRMATIYDITELSTSVKPWALQMLLDQGAEVATYLDPDIIVYDSLSEIEKLARAHGIVLTPHTVTPMPRDGLRPTEADIMSAGIYNLGFIGVGAQARDMLTWWQQHLSRESIIAPQQMVFVDQRWIDLVPGYFEHAVLRDPGYNVAYWNLDSRRLERRGDRITVNGEPLRFFHFSGYRPRQPWILSHYVSDNPRVVLSEHPVVRELCDRYGELIQSPEGAATNDIPYRFSRLSDGTPMRASVRAIYRAALADAESRGTEPPPLPFSGDDSAVLEWLREPVRANGHVNRFLYGRWESRPDLRNAFPEPLGAHEAALIEWAWTQEPIDPEMVASLMPDRMLEARPRVYATSDPGVNVAGYFKAELGVGEMGRLLVDGVRAAGLPLSTITTHQTLNRQNAYFDETASPVRYPVVAAAVNADAFPSWVHEVGADLLKDRHVIGMWAWEIEDFPDNPAALALVDEIWTLSEFGREAIARATDKPVHVIPLPIPEPPPHHALNRELLGLPDGPYFLFTFDYFSIFERKNPIGVVTAFSKAFAEGEGPTLVIKSINGAKRRTDRDRLRLACATRSDIVLIEDYLDADDLSSLMGDAAAYVSLHRSEGYGLTMSEAMARARPVIATGYSGNLDFMDEDSALLVPYRLTPVPPGCEPYPTTARWAEPDLDVAAEHMRWVFQNPEEAEALGVRAREHVRVVGSLERTARFISEQVSAALVELNQKRATRQLETPQESIGFALELINTPPDVETPSRLPRVARRFRQVVYRTLAHHDQQVNERLNALARALRESDAEAMQRDNVLRAEVRRLQQGVQILRNGDPSAR